MPNHEPVNRWKFSNAPWVVPMMPWSPVLSTWPASRERKENMPKRRILAVRWGTPRADSVGADEVLEAMEARR